MTIWSFANITGVEQDSEANKSNFRTTVENCRKNEYGDSYKSLYPVFEGLKYHLMEQKRIDGNLDEKKLALLTRLQVSKEQLMKDNNNNNKERAMEANISNKIEALKSYFEASLRDLDQVPEKNNIKQDPKPLLEAWLMYMPQDKSTHWFNRFTGFYEPIKGYQPWIFLLFVCEIGKLIDKKLELHKKRNQKIRNNWSFWKRTKYNVFALLHSSALLRKMFGDSIDPDKLNLKEIKKIKSIKDVKECYVEFFLKKHFNPITAYYFMNCFSGTSFFYPYSIGWLEALFDGIWCNLSHLEALETSKTEPWYKSILRSIILIAFQYLPKSDELKNDFRYRIRIAAKERMEQIEKGEQLASLGPISVSELKECMHSIEVTPIAYIIDLASRCFSSKYWIGTCLIVLYYIVNYFFLLAPEETI